MTNPEVIIIDVHELKNRWDADPHLYVIDVREKTEWQALHIPGAHHIPKDELAQCITTKITSYDVPIYLHCRSGVRSLAAAKYLLEMGYQKVYSIKGGITEWAQANYLVETSH